MWFLSSRCCLLRLRLRMRLLCFSVLGVGGVMISGGCC